MADSLTQLRKQLAEQALELAAIRNEPRARALIIEKLVEVDATLTGLLEGYHLCPQELDLFSELRRKRLAKMQTKA